MSMLKLAQLNLSMLNRSLNLLLYQRSQPVHPQSRPSNRTMLENRSDNPLMTRLFPFYRRLLNRVIPVFLLILASSCSTAQVDVPLPVIVELNGAAPISELDLTVSTNLLSFTKAFRTSAPGSFATTVTLTLEIPANSGLVTVCVSGDEHPPTAPMVCTHDGGSAGCSCATATVTQTASPQLLTIPLSAVMPDGGP